MAVVQRLLPGVGRGWIVPGNPPDPVGTARILGVDLLTAGLVDEAHRHGIMVIPWTLNSAADWRRALDLGAEGIATDDPCRARAHWW